MSLIKAPLVGEFITHVVELYCKTCRKVTRHDMKFAKYDEEDGMILASCWCQNVRTKKEVRDTKWEVIETTWVCSTYQCLSLTKESWLLLVAGLHNGGAHKRRL